MNCVSERARERVRVRRDVQIFGFCSVPLVLRLNGFLGLSMNDRTILFLVILLENTVIVG